MKRLDTYLDGSGISVSYTLKTDDITKGEKSPGTPYDARKAYFNADGYEEKTDSTIFVKNVEDGYFVEVVTRSAELSQFGLDLPLNFMGKRNLGGWRKQYLFNSPYASTDNEHIYCFLSNPDGNHVMLVLDSPADGWKMDYSSYLGGRYFCNLKLLANFDKAYQTGSRRDRLSFYLFEVDSFEAGLQKVAKVKGLPVLTYDKSGGRIGERISFKAIGKCDHIEIDGEIYPYDQGLRYEIHRTGTIVAVPYANGKRGLDCRIYGYETIDELYKRSVDSIDLDVVAKTDGNLCEHQCWVSAALRYMLRYGGDKRLETIVKEELARITETEEDKAIPRRTIFFKAHGRFPEYNVYQSGRVQELAFGVTILLDAYEYFGEEKYLTYVKGAMNTLLCHYQKEDGRIETYTEWTDTYDDYTTVCCPMISFVDAGNFLKERDPAFAKRCFDGAAKMAAYLYGRGLSFPTEGGVAKEAESDMEDGSISCTALALLYYCAHVKREEKYICKAKEILDLHECWMIQTPIAPMYRSSLRWWETKWEGDRDGNALCCGHAWTIWRAEADHLYYTLTGDRAYYLKAYNGFMSNFSKINEKGESFACYQPDYITGGGFARRSEDVEFRIARGFPRQVDSGLSRYVWIRACAGMLQEMQKEK